MIGKCQTESQLPNSKSLVQTKIMHCKSQIWSNQISNNSKEYFSVQMLLKCSITIYTSTQHVDNSPTDQLQSWMLRLFSQLQDYFHSIPNTQCFSKNGQRDTQICTQSCIFISEIVLFTRHEFVDKEAEQNTLTTSAMRTASTTVLRETRKQFHISNEWKSERFSIFRRRRRQKHRHTDEHYNHRCNIHKYQAYTYIFNQEDN